MFISSLIPSNSFSRIQVLHIQLFFNLSFGTLQRSSLTEPPSASTPSASPGVSRCPTPSPSPILAPDSTTQPVASHNMGVGMEAGAGMVGTGMGGSSELMGALGDTYAVYNPFPHAHPLPAYPNHTLPAPPQWQHTVLASDASMQPSLKSLPSGLLRSTFPAFQHTTCSLLL
ncbi:hypothetical protein EV424DRAFT_1541732 [Suillus variegatus]|nr:hypothetical protein EV424DRAFT_1541732 [Suillus variegatus]